MKFGINFLARDTSADMRDLARRIEDMGFDSLFLPEHTHIPRHGDINRLPSAAQIRMPRLPDPILCLTAVAAVTERLKIGTGVLLVGQHEPILLAKQLATLDQISGGRVLLGVGAGLNRTEARHHGIEARDRWPVMREHILATKAIWTQDVATYHGDFVHFDQVQSWPKPAQRPHPPFIVGGEGPNVLDRVIDYGDAWGPHPKPDTIERIAELQDRAAAAGRDSIPVTLFNVELDVELIQRYEAAGVERCVLYIYDAGPEENDRLLARYGDFIRAYSG